MVVKRKKPPENLFSQIKEALPAYPRAFKQLGGYILAQGFAASSMSIEELAQAAQVSVATVNRFAHECGFEGYVQFKAALRSIFDHIFEPIEKARTPRGGEKNIALQSLDNSITNLQCTQKMLDCAALDHAIKLILSSTNVYVAGMGISTLHASFLVNAIEPFLSKTHIQELSGFCGAERAFSRAAMFTSKDLLIAISLPRYSKSIVDLVSLVHKNKCRVLVLTDRPSSPLVPFADEALFAVSYHPVLYASNVTMMALIDVLTMALTSRISNFAECVASQTEAVLPYFYLSQKD